MFDWLPASTGGLTKDFCGHHDKHFLDLIFWGMRSNFISHLWFTYPNFTLSYVWGIQSILVRSLIAQQTDKSYIKNCIDGTIALPVNTQLSSASLPFFCCSFTTIWPQNQWWQLTKTWTTGKTQKLQITLEEFGLTFLSWGVTFLWWAESVWHLINVTIRVWTCCQSVSKEAVCHQEWLV